MILLIVSAWDILHPLHHHLGKSETLLHMKLRRYRSVSNMKALLETPAEAV